MEQIGMTIGDIILLAVMLFSGLLALIRGFIREMLGLIALILAIVVTIMTHEQATTFANQYLQPEEVAEIAAGVAVFILAWFVFAIIFRQISKVIAGMAPGMINRSLGFAFGLVRGLVIVAIIYLVFDKILPGQQSKPEWVNQARFLPMVTSTATFVAGYLPKAPEDLLMQPQNIYPPKVADTPDASLDREALKKKLQGFSNTSDNNPNTAPSASGNNSNVQ